MSTLFGTKYFAFIASAYGVTALVCVALVAWVLATQWKRRAALAALEEAGLRRARRDEG